MNNTNNTSKALNIIGYVDLQGDTSRIFKNKGARSTSQRYRLQREAKQEKQKVENNTVKAIQGNMNIIKYLVNRKFNKK